MYRAAPKDGVAWITGASSGIGRQVALELAARGFTVVATARRRPELETLADEAKTRRLPGLILPTAGDATDPAAMRDLFAAIVAAHGRVALAFLNVGTFVAAPGNPWDADAGWATFEANVRSVANTLDPVVAHMRATGRGQIAINASLAGWVGLPGSGYYGASKAALIHLAETLRATLRRDGVTVQVVTPGFVATPLTSRIDTPMPFLMPVDAAGRRIADGLRRDGFVIRFPWQLAWMLKLLRILPYPLYFRLAERVGRSD